VLAKSRQSRTSPDSERWSTGDGPRHYPFVRSIGGVSLFDFTQFEPNSYSERYPASQWRPFVPYPRGADSAIWIEIDRRQIATQFISGSELIARWKSEKAYGHRIMPYIEAAHLGAAPQWAFKRAFRVRSSDDHFLDVLGQLSR